jgi:hypothetical protein
LFNDKDKAIEILKNGIYKDANVSAIVFTLVKYYLYLGYNEVAIKDTIFKWILGQDINEKDLKNLPKYFNSSILYMHEHNPVFRDYIDIPITLEEIQALNQLPNKCDKLVAFALIYVSKIFANEEGVFSCKNHTLCSLTNVGERQVIYSIKNIINIGLLIPIQINKIKSYGGKTNDNYGFVYSYPNKYKININTGEHIIHHIINADNIFNDFVTCFYLCLTNYHLKISRRFKQFLQRNI